LLGDIDTAARLKRNALAATVLGGLDIREARSN
jgi:hypothetical protein